MHEKHRCGDDCAKTFRLRYMGQYATIGPAMSEEDVADRLMALSTIKVWMPPTRAAVGAYLFLAFIFSKTPTTRAEVGVYLFLAFIFSMTPTTRAKVGVYLFLASFSQ